jgi:hypothetical protein
MKLWANVCPGNIYIYVLSQYGTDHFFRQYRKYGLLRYQLGLSQNSAPNYVMVNIAMFPTEIAIIMGGVPQFSDKSKYFFIIYI